MKFSINEAPSNVMGEFAMCLLNGVTAGHIHHLGTDSYSQHMALHNVIHLPTKAVVGALTDVEQSLAR